MKTIGIAVIGCGGIALQNHLPGIALCPEARVVALCDSNPEVLQRAGRQTGIDVMCATHEEIIAREDVHAVIIATPNFMHAPIALAAVRAGKHVLCEKPMSMTHAESVAMCEAAESAGVRHMVAFTYRFVPAMRYMAHLVKTGAIGNPYHFRACRLQDWDQRALGWRQVARLAGTGELGDMLSHRIDFAHLLVGPFSRLVALSRRYHDLREGQASDLEDWVAIVGEFASGATGVLESSKVATGRGESWRSQDYCEVNGSEGSLVFFTERWNELQLGRKGGSGLETIHCPPEFLKTPGSSRDPRAGDPLVTFRYDQAFEFIDAISRQRPCQPSFRDGVRAQAVTDAAVLSAKERRWVDVSA